MRLAEISFERLGAREKIDFLDDRELKKANFITILNGENGAGKSSLLRAISDFSLGRKMSRQSGGSFKEIVGSFREGDPKQTIALSGTTNDRFPNTSSGDLRLTVNQFDIDGFLYFGPKYSGGIASHTRASSNITRAVLSNFSENRELGRGLSSLLRYLGFGDRVKIRFQEARNLKRNREPNLRTLLERISKVAGSSDSVPRHVSNAMAILKSLVEEESYGPKAALMNLPMDITFNVSSSGIDRLFGLALDRSFLGDVGNINDHEVLSALISIGLITVDVSFELLDRSIFIDIESMSSGQWQLINCLFNLTAFVEDDTLVLVDEPENSLHPQWQRDYISLIRRAISHRSGCHIVIATHSPLLVSSLLPHDGNVIRLEREGVDRLLRAIKIESAYGWIPGDVLREKFDISSERAPEFEKAVNSALGILKNPTKDQSGLKGIVRRLITMRRNLPEYDTIRDVLDIIIESVEDVTTTSNPEVD